MSSQEKDDEKIEGTVEEKNKEILEIEKKLNLNETLQNKSELKIEENNHITEKNGKKEVEKKSDKKNKNKKMWIVILCVAILILTLFFSTIFAILNLGKQTIAKGVFIKGIDVSNLTVEEATAKLDEAINIELMLETNIKYGEDYNINFDANQIQYTYNTTDAIKQAYSIGKNGNILLNNYTILMTAFNKKDIELEGEYNEASLNGIIDDIASKVPGLVVQASYYIEGEELIIEKGKFGIEIDKEQLKIDILENISNRNAMKIIENSEPQIIEIQVKKVEPDEIDLEKIYSEVKKEPQDAYYVENPFQLFKEQDGVDFAISMEEAKNIISNGIQEEYKIPLKFTPASKTIDDIGTEAFPYIISSFSTKYDASNTNRSANLKIATNKINGTVLMPGEEFSFNEVVGKRTIEDGYQNAKIYENGKVVDGLAGGICQISSTLYNAVLLANLEVTERRNHSYTASYVPAGRDATVVYGTQDFKFKNTRTYPIKIEANVSNGIAEFKIHGIKEEVEYEIKIIPVTTQTIPYQTEYVPDSTLAPGQQVVTQAGHSGYKVTTYIEKRLAGVSVSKEVLSNDTYNAMKNIVNVGQ